MIVKSGRRICGTGAALANAPLVQDKSYFEIMIQCGGKLHVPSALAWPTELPWWVSARPVSWRSTEMPC